MLINNSVVNEPPSLGSTRQVFVFFTAKFYMIQTFHVIIQLFILIVHI